MGKKTAEEKRLQEYRDQKTNWKHWGPYLSDRAWGTVREDYSEHGTAWDYFTHDDSRSRAYRWGEDGIGGISDRAQYLCFAPAYWNTKDSILKERYFGLTAHEGNHGEDVKEYYYYLDSTPTHSYMKMLYKYPHRAFPYAELVSQNRSRGKFDPEFELIDTGIFSEDRCFDCFVEYAKVGPDDLLIQMTLWNRGSEEAELHVLPTIWFRNTWSWGYPAGPMNDVPGKPRLSLGEGTKNYVVIEAEHPVLGIYYLYAKGGTDVLFTENETNWRRYRPDTTPTGCYYKDAFHRYLVNGDLDAINPALAGTKAAVHYRMRLAPGEQQHLQFRLTGAAAENPFQGFDATFKKRISEADEFFQSIQTSELPEDTLLVQRQALAGLLWTKQLFYYDVEQWLSGDPIGDQGAEQRKNRRNLDWVHLTNFDIISMPDKWEYPWYAAWDLAFHAVAFSIIDSDFAKRQLELMTREWYMHPNGQLPAYEWAFNDVNPPVHAGACWRLYKIDAKRCGTPDFEFLEGVFHKLLLNFTWWVNRKDKEGLNIFQGGFLGLDNIGVFDRSAPLPTGGHIDQADGTSWMAAYCLSMLRISLELASHNPVYQDMASKFLEHFLRIAHAMTNIGGFGHSLWDEEDGFFYDLLHLPDGSIRPLKIRSLVGLIPLFAVDTIEPDLLQSLPDFKRRLKWFVQHKPHLSSNMARLDSPGEGKRRLLAIVTKNKLVRILKRMFDENEFLSPYGIRSLSKFHQENPFRFNVNGSVYTVDYQPAESTTSVFGGNSNWRGPIWFPINFLMIEALQRFHHYYGETLQVEYPTGSGKHYTLNEIAGDLSRRLMRLFEKNEQGWRPCFGSNPAFSGEHWRGNLLFHEYFHPDTGAGLGANHQTGWTALIAKLIQQSGAR